MKCTSCGRIFSQVMITDEEGNTSYCYSADEVKYGSNRDNYKCPYCGMDYLYLTDDDDDQ